ncbi:hypothetical protein WA158_000597 [Blastocystis sp. Blastoise]
MVILLSSFMIVSSCVSGQVNLTIVRTYTDRQYKESISLFEIIHDSKKLVDTIEGFDKINATYTTSYCVNQTYYLISASDIEENGWSTGSFFSVYIDDIQIIEDRLDQGSYQEWPFYSGYIINKNIQWRYTNDAQFNTIWKSTDYDDSKWKLYYPLEFPNNIMKTRYYRAKVTLSLNQSDFSLLYISMKLKEGCVVYINGKEVFRRYMNIQSIIGPNTYAIKEDYYYEYREVTVSTNMYLPTVNTFVVAIEIHPSSQHIASNDLFNCFIYPFYGKSTNRFLTGTVSNTEIPDYESVINVFDHNRRTYWNCTVLTECTFILSYINDRREYINEIELVSNPIHSFTDPASISFYGSDDQYSWQLLLSTDIPPFQERQQSIYLYLPSHTTIYSNYKFSIDSIQEPSYNSSQVSCINFLTTNQINYIDTFQYPQSSYNLYIGIPFFIAPISSASIDFILSYPPTLPKGILFTSKGIIKGIPEESILTTFIISATDTFTLKIMTIYLSIGIFPCSYQNNILVNINHYSYSSPPSRETFSIINSKEKVLYTFSGISSTPSPIQLCLPMDFYTILLSVEQGYIWNKQSYITIHKVSQLYPTSISIPSIPLLYISLPSDKQSLSIPLNLNYIIPYYHPETLCHISTKVVPQDWYKIEYIPNQDWNTCYTITPKDKLSYVQYYRKIFTIKNLSIYTTVEIELYSTYSLVIYINNNKEYSTYIDVSEITINSPSSSPIAGYIFRTITFPIDLFEEGNNTISIAQIYTTSDLLNNTILFTYGIRLLKNSIYTSRIWGYSIEGKYSNDFIPNHLISKNPNLFWLYDYVYYTETSTNLLFIPDNNLRYEFYNNYCFTISYDYINYEPKEWYFYGCINENKCIELDYESNILWLNRNEKRCFNTRFHIESYPYYKFKFIRSTTNNIYYSIVLSSISLNSIDYDSLPIEEFEYVPKAFIIYKGSYFISPKPNSDLYHNITCISSDFPLGLSIDRYSGIIYGTPIHFLPSSTYIIRAYDVNNKPHDTTIYLVIDKCYQDQTNIQFIMDTSSKQFYQKRSLSLTSEDGLNTIFNYDNIPSESIILSDNLHQGWDFDIFCIYYNNGSLLNCFSPSSVNYYVTKTFKLEYRKNIDDTPWVYLNSNSIKIHDNHWTMDPYNVDDWSIGTPDKFGKPLSITQYYRLYIEINHPLEYSVLGIILHYIGGYVVYLNGVEISRENMPQGEINRDTKAILTYNTIMTNTNYIPITSPSISFLSTYNLLSIETHMGPQPKLIPYFSGRLYLLSDHVYMSKGGIYSSDYYTDIHNLHLAFDQKIYTYLSSSICENLTIDYQFLNDNHVYVSSYTLINTNNPNALSPSNWLFLGSNDNGYTWNTLHIGENIIFDSPNQDKRFDFYIETAYNMYRLHILDCKMNSFGYNMSSQSNTTTILSSSDEHILEISEIQFYSNRVQPICNRTDDNWPMAAANTYSIKSCPGYYIGELRRFCFLNGTLSNHIIDTCHVGPPTLFYYSDTYILARVDNVLYTEKPHFNTYNVRFRALTSLPLGINISETTGILYGTPYIGDLHYNVTLEAYNEQGSIETILYIIIEGTVTSHYCLPDNDWPLTVSGFTISKKCNDEEVGIITRLCLPSLIPEWQTPINTCMPSSNVTSIQYDRYNYIFGIRLPVQIIPSIQGEVYNWTIIPRYLPDGLLFNNGIISGEPQEIMNTTRYNITAYGYQTITVSILITVTEHYCQADGLWPLTNVNNTAFISCISTDYEGYLQRECILKNTPQWGPIIDKCQLKTPYVIYPTNYITIDINSPIENVIPICHGICSLFVITPSLPYGLILNDTTGIISGIPYVPLVLTDYCIAIYNIHKNTSVKLSIQINDIQCLDDKEWSAASKGTNQTISCYDDRKEGFVTRACVNLVPPNWLDPYDTCIYKRPYIIYDSYSYIFYKNIPIKPIIPLLENYIEFITISPSLPNDIYISKENGTIYGKPSTLYPTTSYTITAKNPDQYVEIHISIAVAIGYCSSNETWPETAYNSTKYLFCLENKASYRSRRCSLKNYTLSWDPPNDSYCTIVRKEDTPLKHMVFVYMNMYMYTNKTENINAFDISIIHQLLYNYLSFYSIPMKHIEFYNLDTDFNSISLMNISNKVYTITLTIRIQMNDNNDQIRSMYTSLIQYIQNQFYMNIRILDPSFSPLSLSSSFDTIEIIYTNEWIYTIIFIAFLVILFLLFATIAVVLYTRKRKISLYQKTYKKQGQRIYEDGVMTPLCYIDSD